MQLTSEQAAPPQFTGTVLSQAHIPLRRLNRTAEAPTASEADKRKANHVNTYFQTAKFSGDIHQPLEELFRDYDICIGQQQLMTSQQADYFVSALTGEVRKYFVNKYVRGMSLDVAKQIMRTRYDGTARQSWVQSNLDRLRLDSFMSESSIDDTAEGLKKMIQQIRSLKPQNPPGFRSKDNQTKIFRKAVFTKTRAGPAIRALSEGSMSFKQFAERLMRSTADTVFHRLARRTAKDQDGGRTVCIEELYIPPFRSPFRHVYVRFNPSVRTFFSTSQLKKLDRHFFHPSPDKLYNLSSRACPEKTTPETLKILKEVSERCDPCQRIYPSFGTENARFNERVMMDVMYLGKQPILHVIDEATGLSTACFLPNMISETVWDTLRHCWATINTGLPNCIPVDRGSNLGDSEPFIYLAERSSVKVETTGAEAHSSLGIGERYHDPLRKTFRKMQLVYKKQPRKLLLAQCVKAMNDTLGPEGLAPSSLVFGELPQAHTSAETRQVGVAPSWRIQHVRKCTASCPSCA